MLTSDNFRCGFDQHGVSASLPPPGPPQPHRNHQNPPELNIQTCQTRWDYDYNTKSIKILRKYCNYVCRKQWTDTNKKKNISVSDFSSNLSDIFRVQCEQVDKLVQVIMENGSCLNIILLAADRKKGENCYT